MTTAKRTKIPPITPTLAWLNQLLQLYGAKSIQVPTDFRDQCNAIEEMLSNDVSGLVNSLLDFAIESACVDFTVETENENLSAVFSDWLKDINKELRGKIPTGINSLAKEYYRERWKKSSFIVLRTIWEDNGEFILPTKMWFANGRDVEIYDDPEVRAKSLGTETYKLIVGKDKSVSLPASQREIIFVQKPFESWSADYPTPYLVKNGAYYNMKFLQMLEEKGANLVNKALEYLMLLKKGDVELAKLNKPEFIYDEDDLKKIKQDLQKHADDRNTTNGVPSYVTNFDTNIEHLIPEYDRALKSELYAPIERRILASIGFIEVVEGITSTRRDSILNPRVFISQINSGVIDFKSMINDVMKTAIDLNKNRHRKYARVKKVELRSSPLKNFFSDDMLQFLRSIYDRGLISKRTIVELGVSIDFDAEIERRKIEEKEGLEKTMFPPVINNIDEQLGKQAGQGGDTEVPQDKQGPEAKNYNAMSVREYDTDLFLFKEDALKRSKQLKATGFHIVEKDGRAFYRPCKTEDAYNEKLKMLEEAAVTESLLSKKKLDVIEKQEKVITKMLKKDGDNA